MARRKDVTASELDALRNRVMEDLLGDVHDLADRLIAGRCEEIPDLLKHVRAAVIASEAFASLAKGLLITREIQEQRAELAALSSPHP